MSAPWRLTPHFEHAAQHPKHLSKRSLYFADYCVLLRQHCRPPRRPGIERRFGRRGISLRLLPPCKLDGPVPGWRGPTRASRVVASLRGCDRHDNPVARPSPSRRPRGSGSRASRCVKCHHSGAPWPDAPPRPPRTQQTRAHRRRVAGGGDAMFGRYARARPLAGAQPHPPSRGCRDEPARRPSRTPEQYPLSARARFPNDG